MLAAYERDRRALLAMAELVDKLVETEIGEDQGFPSWKEALSALPSSESANRADGERVRMALQDLLEATRDLGPESVKAVDQAFAAAGVESLSSIRGRVWRTTPEALKRGRIRNEVEYYLLVERLNDVECNELDDAGRARLSAMIDEFERKAAEGSSPPETE